MSDEQKFDFYDNTRFELRLIFNLAHDKNFLDDIISILKPEYFNGAPRRWIVRHAIDWYGEFQKPISYDSIERALRKDEHLNSEEFQGIRKNVMAIAKALDSDKKVADMLENKEAIQQSTKDFCTTKRYVEAIKTCAGYVGTKDEDKIQNIISEAEMDANPIHIGTDFFDMQSRLDEEPRRDVVPTPWKALNDYIGGVGKNELVTWIAGMGSGKSTIASNLGLYAMKQGFNVVLYTLELGEAYNRARVDSIMMKEKAENLPHMYEEIAHTVEKYKENGGSLTIKKFGSGITANTIINHFKRLTARGKKPDLFLIDYIDLMDSVHDSVNRKTEWEKFGEVTKEIRNEICFKQDIGGHAFVQGNTSAIQEFVIRADSSSGGARRLFPADVVLGVARPEDLKAQEKLNLSIIKSRFSEDGFYLKGDTDYSIGQIELHEDKYYNMHEDETLHTENSIKNDYQKFKKKRKTQADIRTESSDEFNI